MQGVPLRIELGPRDVKQNQVVVVRRDTADKKTVSQEGIGKAVLDLLDTIQKDLYAK